MTSIFVILILIFISISLWQMIKIFDLSKAISGVKIDDSQIANDKDNSTQAKLMLAFLAFIYAITIFSIVKYGKFPLISNAASEHGDKIDTLIVTWPGGKKQILTEIPINDHINIDEIESKEESFIDWIVNFFNFAS